MRPARKTTAGLLVAIALTAACRDPGSVVGPSHSPVTELASSPASPEGRAAFTASCAGCHSSRDGFDLALFSFADSTIVRRAVFHVDSVTASAILRHVRSLPVAPVERDTRPFQVPSASSDTDFSRKLFGRDAWPAGVGERELLMLDPVQVAAAVDFPVWSDEATNLDWMPDAPLPPSVLGEADSDVQKALRAYYTRPSDQTLVAAMGLLRRRANHPASGPCAQTGDGALAEPAVCFEVTRWVASLGAQHALRADAEMPGRALPARSTLVQDAFWDVGQAARRGLLKNQDPVPHAQANWVSWMYLGWVLAPGNHASGYTASGLSRVGLPRHATFVALRSMASRSPASHQPYADLATAAAHAPRAWLPAAYATGLHVLEAREGRGWTPDTDASRAEARNALDRATATLTRRLGAAVAEPLLSRTRALRAGG